MPRAVDLMGLGLPGPNAAQLGNTPITLTCTGTTQATAATIPNGQHMFIIAATAAANGAIFQTNAPIGTPMYVSCATGATLATANIYCQVGGTMNTATNGSVLIGTGKSAVLYQNATNTWISVPTSP